MGIPVLSDFSNENIRQVQFWGVIPPATDVNIYIDNISNEKLNTPTGILRVVKYSAKLYNDSTNELIASSIGLNHNIKIYRDGFSVEISENGSLASMNYWRTVTESFFPGFTYNSTTGDLHIFIDYTNGANDFAYDLRLVVDVEYEDYIV